MAQHHLSFPYTEDAVRALHIGDTVLLSGILHTGRDRFHKFLAEGNPCPVDLREGALFHCGPVVQHHTDGSWSIVSAGPTTSCREDPYMPSIIAQQGLRLVLGKGGMGPGTVNACATHGCAYLQVVGGAAALLASHITRVVGVHKLEDFGATEACWTLEIRDFPALVGIDAHGQSLFNNVKAASQSRLQALLQA